MLCVYLYTSMMDVVHPNLVQIVGKPTVSPTTPSLLSALRIVMGITTGVPKGGGRRGNRRFPYSNSMLFSEQNFWSNSKVYFLAGIIIDK